MHSAPVICPEILSQLAICSSASAVGDVQVRALLCIEDSCDGDAKV